METDSCWIRRSKSETHRRLDRARTAPPGRDQPHADHHWPHPLRDYPRLSLSLGQAGVASGDRQAGFFVRADRLPHELSFLGVLHPIKPVWRTPWSHRRRVVLLGHHCLGRRLHHLDDRRIGSIEPTGRDETLSRAPHP